MPERRAPEAEGAEERTAELPSRGGPVRAAPPPPTRRSSALGAATAARGLDTIARMVTAADGRLQVMAGGGVRVPDIRALAATGAAAVHLSARRRGTDAGKSGPGGGGSGRAHG